MSGSADDADVLSSWSDCLFIFAERVWGEAGSWWRSVCLSSHRRPSSKSTSTVTWTGEELRRFWSDCNQSSQPLSAQVLFGLLVPGVNSSNWRTYRRYTFFENSIGLWCQMFWLVPFNSWSVILELPLRTI